MKLSAKRFLATGLTALVLSAAAGTANAWDIVFDPSNYAQNVVTAAKAVQGEIYQDTNIVYQYQMELNQLKQATRAPIASLQAQYSSLTSDIGAMNGYINNLQGLYGNLQSGQAWVSNVQALAAASGKSAQQYLNDQITLAGQGNQEAINRFQNANTIATHSQQLMQRRQQLQDSINSNPTAEAAAENTSQYLDLVSSQNNDLLQLQIQAAQAAAQKQGVEAAQQSQNAQILQQRMQAQQQELNNLGITVSN
jgi:type IV secretion system protein TrbJ